MKFVVDAQLPPALAQLLVDKRHDAEHVADIGCATQTTPPYGITPWRTKQSLSPKTKTFRTGRAKAPREQHPPSFGYASATPVAGLCFSGSNRCYFRSKGDLNRASDWSRCDEESLRATIVTNPRIPPSAAGQSSTDQVFEIVNCAPEPFPRFPARDRRFRDFGGAGISGVFPRDLGELAFKTGGRVVVVPGDRKPTMTGAAATCRF